MARSLLQLDAVVAVKETELALGMPADPDVTYYLRPITVAKGREISALHTTTEFNRVTHRKDRTTDEHATLDALLEYCLVKWDGIKNGSDPAPCDPEHIKMLPAEVQLALVSRAQQGQVTPAEREASFRKPTGVL
jgi:hypothetical protein